MSKGNEGELLRARERFARARFIAHLGLELLELGPGVARTAIDTAEWQEQAEGFVHAGVLATMADHTAGAAGGTLVGADEIVLTAEFKVNLLRPARRGRYQCRAEVVKPGRRLTVAEARVFPEDAPDRPVAIALVTLAVVPSSA